MGLKPVANELWCQRPATQAEQNLKRQLLSANFSTVVQTTEASSSAQALLAAEITRRHPTIAPADLSALPALEQAGDLVSAALQVPEDLCLLQLIDNDYVLVAACVTAPSYWYLPEKIGSTLEAIHEPVQGLNETLGERMQAFLAGLPANRTFMRRNWFLHASDILFQPRADERSLVQTAEQALKLWVRCETQTLRRLSAAVVAFTIAIECQPLADIRNHPLAAQSLLQALTSRTNAERAAASQEMYEQGTIALLSSVVPG